MKNIDKINILNDTLELLNNRTIYGNIHYMYVEYTPNELHDISSNLVKCFSIEDKKQKDGYILELEDDRKSIHTLRNAMVILNDELPILTEKHMIAMDYYKINIQTHIFIRDSIKDEIERLKELN